MTPTPTPTPTPASPQTPAKASLSPSDLAELMSTFNDITGKLTATHETLQAEVARLTRELSDANLQLERSRRLAALGEMAAGIAHEVRNPLGCIRLYARMLVQDLAEMPAPREIASKIGRAAAGLDGIVGDVLTFSREFKARRSAIIARDLFDSVLESVCHDGTPGWREVTFKREGDDVELVGDPGLLRQALVNLVRNGVEAAREGAQNRVVTLIAQRGRGRGRARADQEVLIMVRDTGPGIPGDVLARMFNPFFTTRATGTGLGLAIVHRIVDAHGGRVLAANNEASKGTGATFTVHLPLTEERAEQVSTGDGAFGAGAVKILTGLNSGVGCMDAEVA